MKVFILCYDADKEENRQVSKAEESFIRELRKEGVNAIIGKWSGKFDKGIDDILLMGCDIIPEKPNF